MKFTRIALSLIVASLIAVSNMQAQEQGTAMKRLQELRTPAPEHKTLEDMVGDWDVVAKTGGQNAREEKGSSDNEWTANKLFVQMNITGTMMGESFHGMAYFGYDRTKRKYNGVWIDDMTGSVATMEGKYDLTARTITYTSRVDNPMTGEKNKSVTFVLRFVDRNMFVFGTYPQGRASGPMQFQMTFTRK